MEMSDEDPNITDLTTTLGKRSLGSSCARWSPQYRCGRLQWHQRSSTCCSANNIFALQSEAVLKTDDRDEPANFHHQFGTFPELPCWVNINNPVFYVDQLSGLLIDVFKE
jgi:hypothetical protein